MKNIINLIEKRDCGFLKFTFVRNYGYDLHKVMKNLGIHPNPDALTEIDGYYAIDVLENILWKDLAYGTEIMPRHEANIYAKALISQLSCEDITYYTNGDWKNYHTNQSAESNNITDATFDAGVLAVSHDYVVFIWVEDED